MSQNQVHLVLQGKGGVGKSVIAAYVTQYFRSKSNRKGNSAVLAFDTDPSNHTLSRYKMLGASAVPLLNDSDTVDPRKFDPLIERVVEHSGPVVIDNGASTFLPLIAYMVENDVTGVLSGAGKEVIVHTVLTGGQALDDTVVGLEHMLAAHTAPVVVWENEYFGPVRPSGSTKSFRESQLFAEHADSSGSGKIRGVVTLYQRNADTYGVDEKAMLSQHLTFEEALVSDQFGLMAKNRLKVVRDSVFTQLDALRFVA